MTISLTVGDAGGADAPYLAILVAIVYLAWWIARRRERRRERRRTQRQLSSPAIVSAKERFLLRQRLGMQNVRAESFANRDSSGDETERKQS